MIIQSSFWIVGILVIVLVFIIGAVYIIQATITDDLFRIVIGFLHYLLGALLIIGMYLISGMVSRCK